MSGATGQLPNVRLGIKEKRVQLNREHRVRNGNSQMSGSTKL
jgi:hypothetical protein